MQWDSGLLTDINSNSTMLVKRLYVVVDGLQEWLNWELS